MPAAAALTHQNKHTNNGTFHRKTSLIRSVTLSQTQYGCFVDSHCYLPPVRTRCTQETRCSERPNTHACARAHTNTHINSRTRNTWKHSTAAPRGYVHCLGHRRHITRICTHMRQPSHRHRCRPYLLREGPGRAPMRLRGRLGERSCVRHQLEADFPPPLTHLRREHGSGEAAPG